MELRRIGPVFGAEITGVDLRNLDDATFADVRRALVEHQVLVLPGQDIEPATHIAFGKRFGPLSVSPFSPNADDAPELMVLDNHRGNPTPLTDIWHSDETFRAEPPLATILRSTIVPELGGDTLFASMAAAYQGLSDRMQAHIAGLTAVHGFGRFQRLIGSDPERLQLLHDIEMAHPHPNHPIVRIHPESGRKVLFVNWHFTTHINELPEEEGRMILDYLRNRVTQPEHQLRISWEENQMVLWDNRSVQHYAPNDYFPQRRRMERVTVAGDAVIGDGESGDVSRQRVEVAGVEEGPTPTEPVATRHFERTPTTM